MKNIFILFISLGILLLAGAFTLCILVFKPTFTSIIIGLAIPFIIFLLLRKKLVQALKVDEAVLEEEIKQEKIQQNKIMGDAETNIGKERKATKDSDENDNSGWPKQNREKLRDFYKQKNTNPQDKINRNDFMALSLGMYSGEMAKPVFLSGFFPLLNKRTPENMNGMYELSKLNLESPGWF